MDTFWTLDHMTADLTLPGFHLHLNITTSCTVHDRTASRASGSIKCRHKQCRQKWQNCSHGSKFFLLLSFMLVRSLFRWHQFRLLPRFYPVFFFLFSRSFIGSVNFNYCQDHCKNLQNVQILILCELSAFQVFDKISQTYSIAFSHLSSHSSITIVTIVVNYFSYGIFENKV